MRALLLILVLVPGWARAGPALSDEVTVGPLSVRPPRGFWPVDVEMEASSALSPGGPEGARTLLELAERRSDGASFTLSSLEKPLATGADARDQVARAVSEHFRALDMELKVSWTTPMSRPAGTIEVVGRVTVDGEERALAMAAVPVGRETWFATLSAPPQRIDDLLPAFEAAVASLRPDPLSTEPEELPSRWIVVAAFATLGVVVAGATRLLRRT